MPKEITILPEEEDLRLDKVLSRLLPDMGLRGRRRLCELGLALVDGRPAKESRKMRPGEVVSLAPSFEEAEPEPAASETRLFPEDRPRLIRKTRHFAFLSKPAAMHTESLAGKPGESLESMLKELTGTERVRLLNRLDYPTSGIVTAALDQTGVNDYQYAQDEGRTEKRYLALLEGDMPYGMLADQRLLLKNRDRVLVELARHPDPRRHTVVDPLAVLDSEGVVRRLGLEKLGWSGRLPKRITLAGCTILKGARHQIRAHCSGLGFPLLGDRRYEARFCPPEDAEEAFFLHHACIILPNSEASVIPPWLGHLGSRAAEEAERWLEE